MKNEALFHQVRQPVEIAQSILAIVSGQRDTKLICRGDDCNTTRAQHAEHLVEALGRRNNVFQHAVAKDDVLRRAGERDGFGSAFEDALVGPDIFARRLNERRHGLNPNHVKLPFSKQRDRLWLWTTPHYYDVSQPFEVYQ